MRLGNNEATSLSALNPVFSNRLSTLKQRSPSYERKSTIVTSNLDIPEWTDAFPNRILGEATVDRLRHGAYTVVLEGKSYRSPRPVSKTSKIACQKSPKNGVSKGGE